jgi:hypothetical protein
MIRASKYLWIVILVAGSGCSHKEPTPKIELGNPIALTPEQANQLADLPLACMQNEYPNKLGQTLGNPGDLQEPRILHPAFYGCFDWHSSVHGHWSLLKLLKEFPDLEKADQIREKLQENISPGNIRGELDYFHGVHNQSYERTYGWGWLLKLAEELHTWDDPLARELESNLQPLTDLIVERYLEFLPKLVYPIRVGEHANTAFGLAFAWDYVLAVEHADLKSAISARAKTFYMEDRDCPINWEPSGYDFLSPCLEEIDLMRRVLDSTSFESWMLQFAPQLLSPDYHLPVGEVSDRSDGKLVHLDGLNFSRAWALYGLAAQYTEYRHLETIANEHVSYSLPNLVGDGYEGDHWLGSFAIYALINN